MVKCETYGGTGAHRIADNHGAAFTYEFRQSCCALFEVEVQIRGFAMAGSVRTEHRGSAFNELGYRRP